MDKFESLEKLAKLKSDGILTDEEFAAEKKKLLNSANASYVDTRSASETHTASSRVMSDLRYVSLPSYFDTRNETFIQMFLSHRGRISRSQWFGRMALMLIAFFLPFSYMEYYKEIKPGFTGSDLQIYSGIGLALMIVWFSSFYGCFAVTAKRFHDLDTTGWAQLIPIYGFLAPLFVQGDAGDNKYGPPPS